MNHLWVSRVIDHVNWSIGIDDRGDAGGASDPVILFWDMIVGRRMTEGCDAEML